MIVWIDFFLHHHVTYASTRENLTVERDVLRTIECDADIVLPRLMQWSTQSERERSNMSSRVRRLWSIYLTIRCVWLMTQRAKVTRQGIDFELKACTSLRWGKNKRETERKGVARTLVNSLSNEWVTSSVCLSPRSLFRCVSSSSHSWIEHWNNAIRSFLFSYL